MKARLDDLPLVEYAPAAKGGSLLQSLGKARRDLVRSRGALWQLFKRDFNVMFRQKLLGYLWAFIGPLVTIASFVFMNFTGILNPGAMELPYPLFVLSGTIVWAMLLATVTGLGEGLGKQGELIVRTNMPKIALALASTGNLVFSQVVSLVTLVIVVLIYRQVLSPWAVLFPVLVLPMFLLGVGIGLLLSAINVLARDITALVATVLGLIMFLCPVVYAPKFQHPLLQMIVNFNPLTYLVDYPRQVFFFGRFEHTAEYLASSGLAVAVLLLGVHGFYLVQDKIAERL
jgi:lipopolysaccharide transport system permease protein